jgi:hypothetical protein
LETLEFFILYPPFALNKSKFCAIEFKQDRFFLDGDGARRGGIQKEGKKGRKILIFLSPVVYGPPMEVDDLR